MERLKIGIVIPALNESSTISKIIKSTKKFGIPIVVNDGSTDNTEKVSIDAGALIVNHKTTMGYDSSINSGFKKASKINCKVVITIDADGEHNPNEIELFINEIKSGADLVIGDRQFFQRFSEKLFSQYTNFCFGIRDPLCGLKAYRIDIYNKLGHFDSYESIGTELAIYAINNSYKFSQIKISTKKRKNQSRFGGAIMANYKILRAMTKSFYINKII